MTATNPILVAIGANLTDRHGVHPLASCRAAAESLRALPGLRLLAISRWYATAPMPVSDQPDYVNGIVRLEGEIAPADLLTRLHHIEDAAGRTRTERNAARVLDLDIVAMGDMVRATPDPILPHPRAHERPFVLAPLADVAPEWIHPVLRQTAAQLLAALPATAGGAILTIL